MKNMELIKRVALLLTLSGMAALAGNAHAGLVYKANNADSLELGSAWVNGNAPGETDDAVWDATAGVNLSSTLNSAWTVGQLRFNNGITSNVDISGTGKINLAGQYIYVSAPSKTVNIHNNIDMTAPAWITFQVAAGSRLILSGTINATPGGGVLETNGTSTGVLEIAGLFNTTAGSWRSTSGASPVTVSGTMTKGTGNFTWYSNAATQVTWNLTGNGKIQFGGDFYINNASLHADFNMDGNSVLSAANLNLGFTNASEVIKFTQNGGSVDLSGGTLTMLSNASNSSVVYALNSGTINLKSMIIGAGGVMKLNGGTVKLNNDSTALFSKGTANGQILVGENGAIIDTNGKTARDAALEANALPLEHDTTLSGKDGGLKVIGGGVLYLSKANSYDGGTVIENATLDVGANATLGTGDVLVGNNGILKLANNAAIDSDATLSFGSGVSIALGYNGTLTLAGLYDVTANQWFAADVYTAADLSAYGFTGAGTLTVLNTIPEPSAWLLIVSGVGLLMVTRKRRG